MPIKMNEASTREHPKITFSFMDDDITDGEQLDTTRKFTFFLS
jgi:hypothetical protein